MRTTSLLKIPQLKLSFGHPRLPNSRISYENAYNPLYKKPSGGLRPLPTTGDLLEQTQETDQNIREQEMRLVEALENFARGRNCPDQQGKALDLKLFIEEMN